MKRPWGSGSVFQRKDGKWVYQVYEGGKARQFYGNTAEEAMQRHVLGPRPKPMPHGPYPSAAILWPRDHTGDQRLAKERREFAESVVRDVIQVCQEQGWTEEYLSRVVVAQLAPSRIKRRITGPCAYCGSWLARTIDHVIPLVAGGTDERDNLVSACFSCNASKRQRRLEDWRVSA